MKIASYKANLIELIATGGVLMFGDFTTKSGRQSPYFINSGQYKTGAQAEQISEYYAALIKEKLEGSFDVLFGPAYKGIPLCTLTAAALFRMYGIDAGYCFNRKEAKDHGEVGIFVGYIPKDGDRLLIIEDVVTAGTAVRESLQLLKAAADVTVSALFVSVDRMERGSGSKSTLDELREEFGIEVFSIINARDIIDSFEAGDDRIEKMEAYLAEYGAKVL